LASGYGSQLKERAQLVDASLQVFTTVIEQLTYGTLVRTHKHDILKEEAHAFFGGIKGRYMNQQLLIGDENIPSDAPKLKDANTAVGTFARLRRIMAGRHINWKKRRAQYAVALPLVEAIIDVREIPLRRRRNFGMAVSYLGRAAIKREQCNLAPQIWNIGAR
jgi:hypothetical protein